MSSMGRSLRSPYGRTLTRVLIGCAIAGVVWFVVSAVALTMIVTSISF